MANNLIIQNKTTNLKMGIQLICMAKYRQAMAMGDSRCWTKPALCFNFEGTVTFECHTRFSQVGFLK